MKIELIGCTGAGKSTLAQGMLRACREQKIDAWLGDDFVLAQFRFAWVKNAVARTFLVDVCSLCACLVTLQKNHEFYRFTIRIVSRLPGQVPLFQKLNIIRNTLKQIGIYEIIHRCTVEDQVVLLDEGTLHTAHYLFVHVAVEKTNSDLATFVGLVPLYDVVVYLKQSEPTLVARTLKRGHKRIAAQSPANTELFIKRALEVFDYVEQQPRIIGRSLVIDEQQNVLFPSDARDPLLEITYRLAQAGIDRVKERRPTEVVGMSMQESLGPC